jgi:hypothetical protein
LNGNQVGNRLNLGKTREGKALTGGRAGQAMPPLKLVGQIDDNY